jgi:hypothetical protein
MHVVVHENIGVDAAARAILIHGEGEEILLEIRWILKNAPFLVAANDDVIEGAGKFDAGLSRHVARITNNAGNVNITALQA